MIPEKWFLEVDNENIKEVGEWRISGSIPKPTGYILSTLKGFWQSTRPEDHEEITTKQFREEVLYIIPKNREDYEAY